MGTRKSIIRAAQERLDQLMAIGESRAIAKAEASARGISPFAFSTGKIHSYQTRATYQPIIMRFVHWCRATYAIRQIEYLDARADELATAYLTLHVSEGKSAWTLQTERAALRLFFQRRDLAGTVVLPMRHPQQITRSRRPATRDHHAQPDHWLSLIQFELACGLRREEVRDVLVRDIWHHPVLGLVVEVRRGKGGKHRLVPAFPGREDAILKVIRDREPTARVFPRLPSALDIQALRRQYAQELYAHLAQVPLPLTFPNGHIHPAQLHQEAAYQVSRNLGHHRLDVLRYYLQ